MVIESSPARVLPSWLRVRGAEVIEFLLRAAGRDEKSARIEPAGLTILAQYSIVAFEKSARRNSHDTSLHDPNRVYRKTSAVKGPKTFVISL